MATETIRTPYTLKGATGEWEVVMGLEVHAQVTSNAKLFSGRSEYERISGRCRHARYAAGH